MGKKIIFDIGHPAQVHNFKYVYKELIANGWEGFFTLKNKEVAKKLLDIENIPYKELKANTKGKLSKIFNTFYNIFLFYSYCKKFYPDIVVSRNSIHATLICKLLKIKHIGLADTENSMIFSKYIDVLLTSTSFRLNIGEKQLRFYGNIELFYLHPNRFTPSNVDELLGVKKDEKYTLVRFVSWDAHHDLGHKGLSFENKLKAVKTFAEHGKVFISSEKELPEEFLKYKINIPSEKMHDVIANAGLLYGESSTMASEAAVLGVPAIFHDNYGRGYTDEEGKFGLVFNYSESVEEQVEAIAKGVEILNTDKSVFRERKDQFLSAKIDVTAFLVWFIENYPESFQIMKENPDYQNRFKKN